MVTDINALSFSIASAVVSLDWPTSRTPSPLLWFSLSLVRKCPPKEALLAHPLAFADEHFGVQLSLQLTIVSLKLPMVKVCHNIVRKTRSRMMAQYLLADIVQPKYNDDYRQIRCSSRGVISFRPAYLSGAGCILSDPKTLTRRMTVMGLILTMCVVITPQSSIDPYHQA